MILVLTPLISFLFKMLLYYTVMKMRNLETQWMTAAMCAGASVIVSLIPMPGFITFAVVIAVSGFFLMKDAEAPMFPDGVGIPFAVEIFSAFSLGYAIVPLLQML